MAGVVFMDSIIEMEALCFSYGDGIDVLNNVDFRFEHSMKAGLYGANGSGKTTLFHIIMGLLRPISGTLRIFGRKRESGSDFKEVRRKIGLLFQDSDDQLFSPTVAEDIAFGPLNLGRSREDVRRIVRDTLHLLGLEGFDHRITFRLSGGEKRLVALGTVLAMDPEVLLLDEPVIGLDEEHREKFIQILKKTDRPYIIISHDREFLREVTNTSFILNNSRIELGS
jgi:cobalt/nickel transport system ATP-binding protein